MRKLSVSLSILIFGCVTNSFADSTKLVNSANKHSYQRFDISQGWYSAKVFCEGKGGYLATITSQNEQDFIWNNFGINNQLDGLWLGATDEKQEGVWSWTTGETWSYTNWAISPDNAGNYGGQNYLMMYSGNNSTWNPKSVLSSWGDMSSLNNFAGAGSDDKHSVSTLCEWDVVPDIYGQVNLTNHAIKNAIVTLKQTGQADKTSKINSFGRYQIKRNDKTITATLSIEIPAGN